MLGKLAGRPVEHRSSRGEHVDTVRDGRGQRDVLLDDQRGVVVGAKLLDHALHLLHQSR